MHITHITNVSGLACFQFCGWNGQLSFRTSGPSEWQVGPRVAEKHSMETHMRKTDLLFAVITLCMLLMAAAPRQTLSEVNVAVPRVNLPQDELPHNVPVEWWYYSGHLVDVKGRRYGVMAGFFTVQIGGFPRQHFMLYQLVEKDLKKMHAGSIIEKDMVKMMSKIIAGLPEHVKQKLPSDLTDMETIERHNKYIPDKPIVKRNELAIKYGEQIFVKTCCNDREWQSWGYKTHLADDAFTIDLEMKPTRGPMYVGGDGSVGLHQGEDMFYYSFTRLAARGVLKIGGEARPVSGILWYDHQFGSLGNGARPIGWDWFCIQLEDGTDLNLSALRYPDTGERFNRLVTIQGADGRMSVVHDLFIEPTDTWTSDETGITYPSGWLLSIPSLGMSFKAKPVFPEQEMRTFGPMRAIWEGACTVEGIVNGKKLLGNGYTELVGYGYPENPFDK